MRYGVIYADPPWSYRDKARAGKRGAEYKYPTMSVADIVSLRVDGIAAADAFLFLWVTPPQLGVGLSVMRGWGFVYKTVAFTWAKTHQLSGKFCIGMGNYTRANAEFCLLGVRGHPKRVDAGVSSLIISPRRAHSRKPDEARDRIVRLCGDMPRVELFACQRVPGWDAWGNVVECTVGLDMALRGVEYAGQDCGGLPPPGFGRRL